jgi:hypothetical protein
MKRVSVTMLGTAKTVATFAWRYRVAVVPSIWRCIARHESGSNYQDNTGNGYFGAYQFDQPSWDEAAHLAGRLDLVGLLPSAASVGDQTLLAEVWQRADGWGAWPNTSVMCGV